MFIACVSVFVKPEYREVFIEASLENARNTRKEPKNLRFDVLQGLDDPDRFFLYEVYRDETGMDDHKNTSHYNKWREAVEEMMAKPREGVKHTNLFPETEEAFLSK
ncbi:MAG: antibiotic biosynthesis monooxygenase [Candidatus Heimdallarchaeota archaeon]|nr:MAG: antibiotic biosynthesis monooxygenase [Candidatus Heimdallarchaeota archaeon]